ncbi:MAG TPA: hypothetical protein PLD53_00935 [Candidatus Propionivibrio aalborgensis]|nr:hypothetical protein [Candidatus Propionivibrio aalborgensis]
MGKGLIKLSKIAQEGASGQMETDRILVPQALLSAAYRLQASFANPSD